MRFIPAPAPGFANDNDDSRVTHDSRPAQGYLQSLLKAMLASGLGPVSLQRLPPSMKIDGKMTAVAPQKLTPVHTRRWVRDHERQAGAEFEVEKECNFAISPEGIGRFRVNIFVQQGHVGMVLRTITTQIRSSKSCACRGAARGLAHQARPVLLVGGTGSGKSTTLAAMIDYRTRTATATSSPSKTGGVRTQDKNC